MNEREQIRYRGHEYVEILKALGELYLLSMVKSPISSTGK
jgi:hypothetical protein